MLGQTIENKIITKIKKAKRGTLFFIEDFIRFGSSKTVGKTLDRLSKDNELRRLAPGIFYRPEISELIGELRPTIDEVAKAIARRDKARIVPTGSYALNRLGLSTQIPMNIVYHTDGSARKVKVGNSTITFKKTSSRNVAGIGEISTLVIQALKSIGKGMVRPEEIKQIQIILEKEKATALEHDIRIAPEWIREIMRPTLKNLKNE
jgi:hypothetical protein